MGIINNFNFNFMNIENPIKKEEALIDKIDRKFTLTDSVRRRAISWICGHCGVSGGFALNSGGADAEVGRGHISKERLISRSENKEKAEAAFRLMGKATTGWRDTSPLSEQDKNDAKLLGIEIPAELNDKK